MAEGTIISDGQGHYKILKGGQWQDYAGAIPGQASGRGNIGKLTPQAQNFLNGLSKEAAEAAETSRIYDRAEQAVRKLHPGPYHGKFLQMATPEDNGGILDTIGGVVLGVPARATGAITKQETDAFQTLRGLQSQQVLQAQLAQKGPQTESDAARMMLTEISPSKGLDVNMDIINKGRQRLQRVRAKADFYTQWANKYGLNGLNERGQPADQIWAKNQDAITASMFNSSTKAPRQNSTIRVISRRKVGP